MFLYKDFSIWGDNSLQVFCVSAHFLSKRHWQLCFILFFQGCYTANTSLYIEKLPSKASAQLFNLQLLHLQTEGPWKAEKTHLSCPVSGEIQEQLLPTWRPAFELISWLFSPQRELLTLCPHRCELTDFPGPSPARQTLLPLLRLKPGLSSHRWARCHLLNPGLPLESPGALPTHHTDAPTGPTQNSVGKASVRSFPNDGQVILMGNQMETSCLNILYEPFQRIQIPGCQVPL